MTSGGLLSKLNLLEKTGRYGKLLANLKEANDKNNFTASILQATIAFQFESVGIELQYESGRTWRTRAQLIFVGRQVWENGLHKRTLLQQDSISSRLARNVPAISTDGDDERQDIVRVQKIVLEKVQKRPLLLIPYTNTSSYNPLQASPRWKRARCSGRLSWPREET
jgi:hypothetical protein